MKKQEPFFKIDKNGSNFFLALESCRKYEQPHTCPICGGRGFVQEGFYNNFTGYSTSTCISPETCRTCNGAGIVWK